MKLAVAIIWSKCDLGVHAIAWKYSFDVSGKLENPGEFRLTEIRSTCNTESGGIKTILKTADARHTTIVMSDDKTIRLPLCCSHQTKNSENLQDISSELGRRKEPEVVCLSSFYN